MPVLMKRRQAGTTSCSLLLGVSMAFLAAGISSAAGAAEVDGLPYGGQVVGGTANFDYSTTNELHITQTSDRAVINWDSFNIGKDALTQFHQNGTQALAVNRVIGEGTDPTQILGRLQANGRVMVLDRNGVLFGKNSVIDAGSIIASTGDVDDDSVMIGNMIDITDIPVGAAIVNEGRISVADAGLAALVAGTVVNNGVIQAKLGRVQIGAGDKVTLDLYGDGLMELSLNKGAQQTLVNNGFITTDGGTVQIEAAAARDIVDNLIVNTGVIAADSVAQKNGQIILYAEGATEPGAQGGSGVYQDGYLSAAGYEEGETGGQVMVLGDTILADNHSIVDTSGDAGGGNIKIGGDYLGGGDTPTARYTYIAGGALIINDALTHGDGGRTIVWSDDTTAFHGSIFGRGGLLSGNGGFTETSGKVNLLAQGHVDLTAPQGSKGTYLLDPDNITIYGNFDPTDISGGVAWYDAADETSLTKTGSDVIGWADKMGAYDLTKQGPGSVTWVENELNDNPVLRFSNANFFTNFQDFNNEITVYWAGTVNTGTSDGIFEISDGNSYNRGYSLIDWGSTMYWRVVAGGSQDLTHAFTIDQSYIYTGWHNGVTSEIFQNNTSRGTRASGNLTNTLSELYVGSLGDGDYRSPNDFGEFIIYDRDHTESERVLMNQYLSEKWGIVIDKATPAQAMDPSTGYGVFTTRYLEQLSETADIVLQASSNITLDLQDDLLNLANDRNISLIATSGDITDISAGTIRTTRTGSGGNITFNAGSGNITLDTTNLEALNGGVVNLDAGGDINLTQSSDLNLGLVEAENISIANSAGHDVTLNGVLNASGTGNALTIAAGRNFINNGGAGALDVPNGRWLIYSSDPADNTLGGLSPAFKRYNKTYVGYAPGSVAENGNGLLYSIAPVINISAQNKTRIYGDANPPFTFSTSGLIDGDTLGTAISGSPAYTALGITADVGTSAITPSLGTLASSLGYQFTFTNGALTITKAPLTVTANNKSGTSGSALPVLTGTITGWKLSDTLTDLDTAPTYNTLATSSSPAGNYAIKAIGATDNNYAFTYVDGVLTWNAAPLSQSQALASVTNTASNFEPPAGTPKSAATEKVKETIAKNTADDSQAGTEDILASNCLVTINGVGCVMR